MNDKQDKFADLPKLKTGPMRIVGQNRGAEKSDRWDARKWLRDHAGRNTGKRPTGERGPTSSTITIQAVICGVVIVAVLVLKALNVPQTTEVLAGLDTALTATSDIDKALGKLKFVGDFFSDSQEVFSPETQGFVPPIKDMAIETGTLTQNVISVDVADVSTPILAAADGQVFYSGASSDYGTLVIIRHQDGYETYYGGISPEVKSGHSVLAGERIGTIRNGTLKFLAYHDGQAFDPRPYMKKSAD